MPLHLVHQLLHTGTRFEAQRAYRRVWPPADCDSAEDHGRAGALTGIGATEAAGQQFYHSVKAFSAEEYEDSQNLGLESPHKAVLVLLY